MLADFLALQRGRAPLIISLPHTGTDIPQALAGGFVSAWQARRDADWHVEKLYAMAAEGLGATILRTRISRSVIDVNRDPSGASLYPGQATTGLCPLTDFDGGALYHAGAEPDAAEIARRRRAYFDPYHDALAAEIARLRAQHGHVVLYDAHSIRSHIPNLFEGELPALNLGTNTGASCSPRLREEIIGLCAASSFSYVADGRFRGGWITRHYGTPDTGVHAVQMELAIRAYLAEPPGDGAGISATNWPPPFDPAHAAALAAFLRRLLRECIGFATTAAAQASVEDDTA